MARPAARPEGLPRVVLVGRPNAGKSTLFNRLLRRRKAIVDPTPGVTRDPNEAVATWDGRSVLLVDTGGFDVEGMSGLDAEVRTRSLDAIRDAAVVLYVLDGKAGLAPADADAAQALRRRHPCVLWVVNKIDNPGRPNAAPEFFALGADDLLVVSAEHGHGVADLVDAVLARLPETEAAAAPSNEGPADRGVAVSVIGRPNVGKSSLVNRLLGYERTLVDATAGTTRDAVDTPLQVGDDRFVLVDTAGLRRRSRVQERVERVSNSMALDALARADVGVLVLDALEGVTSQDQRLALRVWEAGRGLVVVVNKWDLRRAPTKELVTMVREQLGRFGEFPVIVTSATTGDGVAGILPAAKRVAAANQRELKTSRLNEVLTEAMQAAAPPITRGQRPRIYYATQTGRRPPEVTLFVSAPTAVHPSYVRYLENRIAEAFHLRGTPLRLKLRSRR